MKTFLKTTLLFAFIVLWQGCNLLPETTNPPDEVPPILLDLNGGTMQLEFCKSTLLKPDEFELDTRYSFDENHRLKGIYVYGFSDVLKIDKEILIGMILYRYIGTDEVRIDTVSYQEEKETKKTVITTRSTTIKKQGDRLLKDGVDTKRRLNESGQIITYGTNNVEYDANGNLTQETYFDNGKVTMKHKYTYDSKKSPFYGCTTPNWLLYYSNILFLNNRMLDEVYRVSSDGNEEIFIGTLHAYSYNDDGYAVELNSLTYDTVDGKYKESSYGRRFKFNYLSAFKKR